MITHFLQAWLIGVAIAAPVGPIGMLCIRKTLETGLAGAIAVGLGAALADGVYGLIAALGLTAISHFLLEQSAYIKLLGGILLLYLAYSELAQGAALASEATPIKKSSRRLTLSVFFLTLTNPATILSFIGIFASIGGGSASLLEMFLLVVGVFIGSMSWWLILGSVIVVIRHKLPKSWLDRIRYGSAALLGGFGVFALVMGIRELIG